MRKINLKKVMILIVIIIIIGIVIGVKIGKSDDEKIENSTLEQNTVKEQIEIEQNFTEEILPEEQNNEVEEIKENTGKTGATELYEVQEGYDNVKIATIKSSVKYKVAFAGIIKGEKPKMQELDSIMENDHPEYAGIYIVKKDRTKFLKYLESVTDSEYSIGDNGYLKIENKNVQNDYDKKLENAINGKKLYIMNISSVCYIVDEITGEILDYSFEKMDKYQTYEYFEDEDKRIIFITENKEKQLDDIEIINSVIDLIET